MELTEDQLKEDSFNLEYEDIIFKEDTHIDTHARIHENLTLNKEMTQSQKIRLERLEPLLD